MGTQKHLVCAGDSFTWRKNLPSDMFHLSGDVKPADDLCLDTLFKLGKIDLDLLPPKQFVSAMKLAAGKDFDVNTTPWQDVMPTEAHRTFIKNIISQVVVNSNKLPVNYYRDTWGHGTAVLRSLQPAKVDVQRISDLVSAGVPNLWAVETFKAQNPHGFAEKITYDRFGTLTGRLTVEAGPSILTLKREHRDLIGPSTKNGQVVLVDFNALEPRVLLYEAGKRCDEPDLYKMLSRELGYDRKAVKGAVISELYGSSKQALGNALGISGQKLDEFVKKVKVYFDTQKLLDRVKSQFYETGNVINRYGRPVTIDEPVDNIFLSYYAQSSAVDVTMLGFNKIIKDLAVKAPKVRPLFVLHDALLLDVPEEDLRAVESFKTVSVPGYVQAFHLKTERLCTSFKA